MSRFRYGVFTTAGDFYALYVAKAGECESCFWLMFTELQKRRLKEINIEGITEMMTIGMLYHDGQCDESVQSYSVRVRDDELGREKTVYIPDSMFADALKRARTNAQLLN